MCQRLLFGFGYVLLPYIWRHARRVATRAEWEERITQVSGGHGQQRGAGEPRQQERQRLLLQLPHLWSRAEMASHARVLLRRLEAAYHVAALLNLAAFLRHGTYRYGLPTWPCYYAVAECVRSRYCSLARRFLPVQGWCLSKWKDAHVRCH